jgi:uncharacterized protein
MMSVASYISPKAIKGERSPIEGRGLFAREAIGAGEIVAIKGGHIVEAGQLAEHAEVVGNSDLKIADGFWLAALSAAEYEDVMLFPNHSCEPNVGVGGNVVFVALREIAPGEELTIDYAMIDDHDGARTCRCGRPTCRGIVTGRDWRRPELQAKYGPYFSWYLQQKMRPATGTR